MRQKELLKKLISMPYSIFERRWQWEIGRNISVWHSEINCRLSYIKPGYKYFGLPTFFQLRLHRGTHCDFYYPVDNKPYNRRQFAAALLRRYGEKKFLSSLRPKYKKILSRLLTLAKNLKPTTRELENFFASYVWAIPTLDITAMGSKVVSDHLEKLLKNNPARQEIIVYYGRERGLAPVQKLQQEIEKIRSRKFDLEKEAKKLHKKYFWIPANFVGEVWTLNDFVEKIKSFGAEPKEKLVKPKVKISAEIKYWARCLGEVAYLNEYRKAYFTKVNVMIRPVLDKIAEDNGLGGWREMSLLTSGEILDLTRGKSDYQKRLIKERQSGPIAFYNFDEEKIVYLSAEEIKEFEKRFKPGGEGLSEVRGTVGNNGLVRGTAKIILSPADFSKFKSGEILIAKMTSTDFIPIMRRAAAFVTDEGGLACHAAIIAREYKKPCVIGTRLATSVFKDGDLVEVDANGGVVRKIHPVK
jgi:phosphohistidine swiveling domain-containing protein